MGGVVLEHESKTIYNKGWMEGRMDAKQAIAMRLYERGTKPEEIAYIVDESVNLVRQWICTPDSLITTI